MKNTLVLLFKEAVARGGQALSLPAMHWFLFDGDGAVLALNEAATSVELMAQLEAVAPHSGAHAGASVGQECIVVLHACDSLMLPVSISSAQRRHLSSVLPFLLEEKIVDDIEQQQVLADSRLLVAGNMPAVVMDSSLLQRITAALSDVACTALAIYPVQTLFADQVAALQIVSGAEGIGLRTTGNEALALSWQSALSVLPALLANRAHAIVWYQGSDSPLQHTEMLQQALTVPASADDDALPLQIEPLSCTAVEWQARQALAHQQTGAFNLLSPQGSPSALINKLLWQRVAVFAGIAFLAGLFWLATDIWSSKRQGKQLATRIQQQCVVLMPECKGIDVGQTRRIRSLLESRINDAGSARNGMMSLLAVAGAELHQLVQEQPAVVLQLKALDFNARAGLQMDLEARNAAIFDQLHQRLQAKQLQAEISSTSTEGGLARARFSIRGMQ